MLSVLKTATLSESDVYGRNFAEMFFADADFLLPEMSFSADLTGCKYNHSEFCCICQIFHSFFDCHFFMAVIFRTVQVCKIGIYNRFASDKANLSTIFGRKGKSKHQIIFLLVSALLHRDSGKKYISSKLRHLLQNRLTWTPTFPLVLHFSDKHMVHHNLHIKLLFLPETQGIPFVPMSMQKRTLYRENIYQTIIEIFRVQIRNNFLISCFCLFPQTHF